MRASYGSLDATAAAPKVGRSAVKRRLARAEKLGMLGRSRHQSQLGAQTPALPAMVERIGASLAPFAAAAALAAIATPIATEVDWGLYAAAIALGALAGLARLARWHGALDHAREVVPSMIFLLAVALLRAAGGGANSGVAIVALLPVFWTALHGDRRQLCLVVVCVALFFLAPLVLVGPPEYPSSQYRAGVLFVVVSAIVGFTTQWLVSEVRFQASERGELLARMADIASTDALTGLPNRRAWDARLGEELHASGPAVLAILDLDRFKDYNDAHGHLAGDRLLRETAAAWREGLRAGDFLARIGGEEFALLLPETTAGDAGAVIERLRSLVPYGQTCSAGLATREPGEPSESVMARADEALYAAKADGRDRVAVAV